MNFYRLILFITSACFLSCNTFILPSVDYTDKMPRETDIPGWTIVEQTTEIKSGSIETYIKNHPSYYRVHDIKRILKSGYQWINDDSIRLTMEVFLSSSALESFGIYSRDRNSLSEVAILDQERFMSGATYHELHGRYYVVITSSRLYDSFQKHSGELADAFKSKIEETASLPEYVLLFSNEKKEKATQNLTYYKKGISDVPGLDAVFVRDVKSDDKNIRILFSKRDSTYKAVQDFSAILQSKDNPFVLTGAADMQTAFRQTDENTYSYLGQYRKWIFGVLHVDTLVDARKHTTKLGDELKKFIQND
ncbi:MAG: DUF6599 family protein [Spirochaetota bacterium]